MTEKSRMRTTSNEGVSRSASICNDPGSAVSYIVRCAGMSKIGYNKGPVNQDTHFEHVSLGKVDTQHLFGVADGHGGLGHLVSDLIKRYLAPNITSQLLLTGNIQQALIKANEKTANDLLSSGIDLDYAGSTLCYTFFSGKSLFCANVGDSRAVLGRRSGASLKAIDLSEDHKPGLPQEKARIVASGGTVHPYRMPGGRTLGPDRVWLGELNIPGLAMSRAFGDLVAVRAGVTCKADIKEIDLCEQDEFVIVATDGVWEFMTSAEAVRIVAPYAMRSDARGAATELVKEAQARWRRKEDIVDDTTAVVVLLNIPS